MSRWDVVKAKLEALRAMVDPTHYEALEAQLRQAQATSGMPAKAHGHQTLGQLKLEGPVSGQGRATVSQFMGGGGGGETFSGSTSTVGSGGAGPGGAGRGREPWLMGRRVTQAEFVEVASQGDVTGNVMLQGDDGPGDLVRLAGYQVQADPATGFMMLTHCEPTPSGATWKDCKRPFPPKGRPYWVRGVTLGDPLPDGTRAVVIHVAHGDRVETGASNLPAVRAADRLRFIPEEDVLALRDASNHERSGELDGARWAFIGRHFQGELPLLYVAQEQAGTERKIWQELYARLLLGEEE